MIGRASPTTSPASPSVSCCRDPLESPPSGTCTSCEDVGSAMSEIRETAVVQLVGDGDRAGRTVSVLGENEVRLACPRVVAFECIGSVQQYDHIRVLFY